jgi:nicotinate phosphoribosyltransferase
MRAGKRLAPPETLEQIRTRAGAGLASLPPALHDLKADAAYEVLVAPSLRRLAEEVDRRAPAAAKTDVRRAAG